jgi:hypothetical protein
VDIIPGVLALSAALAIALSGGTGPAGGVSVSGTTNAPGSAPALSISPLPGTAEPVPVPTGQPAPPEPECPSYPPSPGSTRCTAPPMDVLPPCGKHLWIRTPQGWTCTAPIPSPPWRCQPPWTFPILVSNQRECLGGPGPVILPPSAPALPQL